MGNINADLLHHLNGDRIHVARRVRSRALHIEPLARRRAQWKAPAPRMNFGWLARYQKMVSNAAQGAVLKG